MIGEVPIGGIYLPVLLVLAVAAMILTAIIGRLLSELAVYRIVANRPLADLCLFVILLGLLALLAGPNGTLLP